MQLKTFILLAAGVAASSRDRVLHEKRNQLASYHDWSEEVIEDRDRIVLAKIGLKQSNLDRAYDHVLDV